MHRLLGAALAVFSLMVLAAYPALAAGITEVTDDTYYDEVIRTYDPVVIEFSAPWCKYCNKMKPVLNDLSKEYAGRVKFVRINKDHNPDTVQRYKVGGIPAYFLVKGGEVAGSALGAMDKERLKNELGLE